MIFCQKVAADFRWRLVERRTATSRPVGTRSAVSPVQRPLLVVDRLLVRCGIFPAASRSHLKTDVVGGLRYRSCMTNVERSDSGSRWRMALIVVATAFFVGGVVLGAVCLFADPADKRFGSGLGASAALLVAGFSGLAAQAVSVVWTEQRRREVVSQTWSKRADAYDTVLAELLKVFTGKDQEVERIRATVSIWAGKSVLGALADWNRFVAANNNQPLGGATRQAAQNHLLAVAVAMRAELFPDDMLPQALQRDAMLPALFDDVNE